MPGWTKPTHQFLKGICHELSVASLEFCRLSFILHDRKTYLVARNDQELLLGPTSGLSPYNCVLKEKEKGKTEST